MTVLPSTADLPCPGCATFSLEESNPIVCKKCGYTTRKLPLKTAYEYAAFVFQYGHQYKHFYEEQLVKEGKLTVKGNLEDPHELHVFITLPILSGITGASSWFLVEGAISSIVASYNEQNGTDYIIPSEDIKVLNTNFREFVNNFADADTRIRNAVFEEMFAAECSTKDKEKLLQLRKQAQESSGQQQKDLENKAEKMLDDMMKKTFKKIAAKPKPTPEELGQFWLNVIE